MKKPLTDRQLAQAKVGAVLFVLGLGLLTWKIVQFWPDVLAGIDSDRSGSVGPDEWIANGWPFIVGLLFMCVGAILQTIGLLAQQYTLDEMVELESYVARAKDRKMEHETRVGKGARSEALFAGLGPAPACPKCREPLVGGECPRCDEALSD